MPWLFGVPWVPEAVLRVELVALALEETVIELGLDPAQARPILGRRLRELDAAP